MPVAEKATGITTSEPVDELPRARAAAFRLLRVRPRSDQELRQRLRQKGFAEPVVEVVTRDLTRQGHLNDAQFARYVATSRLSSTSKGLRAVRDELRRRGIAPALAEQTMTTAAAGYDELGAAQTLAARRRAQWAALPAATVQRRLFGLLQRRGFSHDVIYRVVRDATKGSLDAA